MGAVVAGEERDAGPWRAPRPTHIEGGNGRSIASVRAHDWPEFNQLIRMNQPVAEVSVGAPNIDS